MTVKEFLKQYNGSPVDIRELAESAELVDGELGEAALELLTAIYEFEEKLEEIGFEWG